MNNEEYNDEIVRLTKIVDEVIQNTKIGHKRLSPGASNYISSLKTSIRLLERQRDRQYTPRKSNPYGFCHEFDWR